MGHHNLLSCFLLAVLLFCLALPSQGEGNPGLHGGYGSYGKWGYENWGYGGRRPQYGYYGRRPHYYYTHSYYSPPGYPKGNKGHGGGHGIGHVHESGLAGDGIHVPGRGSGVGGHVHLSGVEEVDKDLHPGNGVAGHVPGSGVGGHVLGSGVAEHVPGSDGGEVDIPGSIIGGTDGPGSGLDGGKGGGVAGGVGSGVAGGVDGFPIPEEFVRSSYTPAKKTS